MAWRPGAQVWMVPDEIAMVALRSGRSCSTRLRMPGRCGLNVHKIAIEPGKPDGRLIYVHHLDHSRC